VPALINPCSVFISDDAEIIFRGGDHRCSVLVFSFGSVKVVQLLFCFAGHKIFVQNFPDQSVSFEDCRHLVFYLSKLKVEGSGSRGRVGAPDLCTFLAPALIRDRLG